MLLIILQVRIPSIPKRIAAEFIDCVILLVAKFLITFIAVEYFELIQLPRFVSPDLSPIGVIVGVADCGHGSRLLIPCLPRVLLGRRSL